MSIFVGRDLEIDLIKQMLNQHGAKILVVNGRRRIGKSTLIERAAARVKFFKFSGLAPRKGLTAQDQIDNFLLLLSQNTGETFENCTNWTQAFQELSKAISEDEKTLILFDEISWMGIGDSNFVGKLKIWWDLYLSKKNVLLVFCGSVSTWIEKNILNSTAFYGRISATINLQPLSIPESVEMLRKRNFQGSPFEFYKILAITGGVPWYLEQINPSQTAQENIENLCFKRTGVLRNEFNIIFNDVFSKHGEVYYKILLTLSEGMKTLVEIRKVIDYVSGGQLTQIMANLVLCGFITKHQQWSFKSRKLGKQSIYRISDPYIRFYLKYVRLQTMEGRDGQLPYGFDAIMGIQMETLLIQNRELILKALNISNTLIDNPYVQKATGKKPGCQIDYLIQTATNNLYLCEFKFKKGYIDRKVTSEVQKKIQSLSIPRGMAIVPILFCMGEVSPAVYESNFFYKIIDLGDFL